MGTPPPPAAPRPQRHRPLRPHPGPKRLLSLLSLSLRCFVPTDPVPVVPIPRVPVPRVPRALSPCLSPRSLPPVSPHIPLSLSPGSLSPFLGSPPQCPCCPQCPRCPQCPQQHPQCPDVPKVPAPSAVPSSQRPSQACAGCGRVLPPLWRPLGPARPPLGTRGHGGHPVPPWGWLCVGVRGTRRSPAPQESRRRRSAE